jgi:surface protein
MRTYNITKNLNANAGRNKYSIPIGTTRNIRGSANRIFQYCNQNSDDPFYCMFGIVKPSPPIKPCLNGFVSYSYTYTGEGTISEAVVKQNLPVYSIADVLNVNPEITIIGNTVYVEIITCLYELPSYPNNVGISLNSNPDIVTFINGNTTGITFTASSNCPFAKNGSQFKGVNNLTITQAKGIKIMKGTKRFREITYFTPYFLPGTSLSECFSGCTNFNSNISGWDTTNVVNMSSMFNDATNFNQYVGNWNTSNITDMSYMFHEATYFNNGETGTMDISGNTPFIYTSLTKSLTSTGAKFTTQLSSSDVLIITAQGGIVYTSQIQSIVSDTSLILLTPYEDSNGNTNLSGITSIKKQVAGSAPLNWNTSNVTNISYMFKGATYFNQRVDTWNVSKVTTMESTFSGSSGSSENVFNNGQLAGSIDTSKLLNNWDTGNVTKMNDTFSLTSGFNQYISRWNTSNVTIIRGMFYNGLVFNNGESAGVSSNDTSLNGWDTSKVTTMESMFQQDDAFNQNISNWKTSLVTNMVTMFYLATKFNNGQASGVSSNDASLNGWDTSNVTSMALMFKQAPAFNQSIENWKAHSCINFNSTFSGASNFNQPLTNLVDTTNVVSCDMFQMFYNATLFNQPLNSWNTSNVTNMQATFNLATSFNQPLNNWNTSNVTNMTNMFKQATSFNQNIGNWNVINVTNMTSMFNEAYTFNNGGSDSIKNWYAPKCTSFELMFRASNASTLSHRFNQPLPILVDTSGVTTCSLSAMFQNDSSFNQNVGGWNVSNVTNMGTMFFNASMFNNDASNSIQSWKAPKCTIFINMFAGASRFNQPLPYLVDTSGVTDVSMNSMFQNDASFNQNVGAWNVSNVTTMANMFQGASMFNNDASNSIQSWRAPKCTNFSSMFNTASRFNQPLPILVDTSGVSSCTINSMFQNDTSFNQDVGNWNVSNVTNMGNMFNSAFMFNNGGSDSIKNWYAPKCTSFSAMFNASNASTLSHRFNQPLPILVDTSGVSSCILANMFLNNTSFNQNVGTWNVSNVTNMGNMFQNASMFNNDASNSIQSWYAPKCTTFSAMFSGASRFNQPLPILVDTSGVDCSLSFMFQNDASFNQNVGAWNVSNVITMANMFQSASMFNNGGSDSIKNWYAPKCISFSSMFQSASRFNQPLPILVDTSGVSSCTINSMFQNDTSFNQDVGNWNVSNVTSMASMFQSASQFNNDASNSIQSWRAPKCTSFSSMFNTASRFNQPLPILVDVSATNLSSMFASDTSFNQYVGNWNVSNVTNMSLMFIAASMFNNGQTGTVNIPNLVMTDASYVNSTRILRCPSGSFLSSDLSVNDILIIRGTNFVYSSDISTNIVSDTSLVLRRPYSTTTTTNLPSSIISIEKQIPGTAPLNWNTSNVTNMSSTFQNATFFNQYINTNGNIWNTNKVINASSMFLGTATSGITLFNNGQIISGTTASMEWIFASGVTLSNFRTNCRLTNENKPSGTS